MRIVPVVMSGGSGTRLWPLSRLGLPKQFVSLIGDVTMIQQTARRAGRIDGAVAPVVVANGSHAELAALQLTEVGERPGAVIAEPAGRNTAPAVALAAPSLEPDDVMVVLPADASIGDEDAFVEAIHTAIPHASEGALVTFGVAPTRPETGYGYIEAEIDESRVAPVLRFVEKPDSDTARDYLESGRFHWNSGMFVFTSAAYLEELARFEPEIARLTGEAMSSATAAGLRIDPGDAFEECASISIDHAVMERTERAVVVALDAGWSDVGSWAALWELSAATPDSNVVSGHAILADVSGSLVRAGDRLVAVIGLDDVVVVDTGDAVLVIARDRAQDVKSIIDRLPPELR